MNMKKMAVGVSVGVMILAALAGAGVSLVPGSHKGEPIPDARWRHAHLFALSQQPGLAGLLGRVIGAGPRINKILLNPISC